MYRIVQRKERSAEDKKEAEATPPPPPPQQQPIRIAPRKIVVEQRKAPATDVIKAELAKTAEAASAPNKATAPLPSTVEKPIMDASIRLIDDDLELISSMKEFLFDTNTKYSVIGAIGAQGTGKSTVLSMLAGNSPTDMYRQYIFRPAAREAVEACRYQTTKISVYVAHKIRTIFLDCQPLNCAPLMEDFGRYHRGKGPSSAFDAMELESLQLLLLLVNVCNTIVLCIDWFIDMSVVRRLMRTELFPAFFSLPDNRRVNLVVLHQRARSQDFQPLLVRDRMRILNGLFADSSFNVNGGLNMAMLGFASYDQICAELDVNYVLLGELRPRTRMDKFDHQMNRWQRDDYGTVMAQLRLKIHQLPNARSISGGKTETQWFSHLADTWKRIREELPLVTEDGCTLKRQRSNMPDPTTPSSSSWANSGRTTTREHGRRRDWEEEEREHSAEGGYQPQRGGGRRVWRMGGRADRFSGKADERRMMRRRAERKQSMDSVEHSKTPSEEKST